MGMRALTERPHPLAPHHKEYERFLYTVHQGNQPRHEDFEFVLVMHVAGEPIGSLIWREGTSALQTLTDPQMKKSVLDFIDVEEGEDDFIQLYVVYRPESENKRF